MYTCNMTRTMTATLLDQVISGNSDNKCHIDVKKIYWGKSHLGDGEQNVFLFTLTHHTIPI